MPQAAAFLLGGVIGYTIGAGMSRRHEAQRARYFGLSVDQVFLSHRWNFQVALASLDRAEFNAGINMITVPRLTLWIGGRKVLFKFMHSYWSKDKGEVQYIREVLAKSLPGR